MSGPAITPGFRVFFLDWVGFVLGFWVLGFWLLERCLYAPFSRCLRCFCLIVLYNINRSVDSGWCLQSHSYTHYQTRKTPPTPHGLMDLWFKKSILIARRVMGRNPIGGDSLICRPSCPEWLRTTPGCGVIFHVCIAYTPSDSSYQSVLTLNAVHKLAGVHS